MSLEGAATYENWERVARPFNPRSKAVELKVTGLELTARPAIPLAAELPKFNGVGIYGLYYTGDLPCYEALATHNRAGGTWPIYIGQAILTDPIDPCPGPKLWRRLSDHRKSIGQANNLSVEDFQARFLVIEEGNIGEAEKYFLWHWRPVWNKFLTGFGSHDPGGGRRAGKPSKWDTLHPGRGWLERHGLSQHDPEELRVGVAEHLEKSGPPALAW